MSRMVATIAEEDCFFFSEDRGIGRRGGGLLE